MGKCNESKQSQYKLHKKAIKSSSTIIFFYTILHFERCKSTFVVRTNSELLKSLCEPTQKT